MQHKQPDFVISDLSVLPGVPFISYAQNGEDVMLWRALCGIECGCYIDVGAGEPEADSVTSAFYRRGWRGINAEPARAAFDRLSASRSEDVNLNIAVGDRNGVTPFFLINGGNGLSTAQPEQRDALIEQGWNSTEVVVPILTLASIVSDYIKGPVHFLKIDVEGSERAVLTGTDFRSFRPWIILVESTAPNSQASTHNLWEDLLLIADYNFVWFDGLNRFYVAAEKSELRLAFEVQPNVFDRFVRHSEATLTAKLVQMEAKLDEVDLHDQLMKSELIKERGRFEEATAEITALITQRADTTHRLEQCDLALQALNGEIAVRCARIEELAVCAEKTAVQISRLTHERDAWMQELFESNRHAAHLTQVRQKLLEALNQLKIENLLLQQKVQALHASTSWKFSYPIRAIATLLGRR